MVEIMLLGWRGSLALGPHIQPPPLPPPRLLLAGRMSEGCSYPSTDGAPQKQASFKVWQPSAPVWIPTRPVLTQTATASSGQAETGPEHGRFGQF